MNRQEHYRREYARLKPGWRDSMQIYRDLIDSNTNSASCILDVGCGHADFLQAIYSRTPHSYGLDPDQRALEKNSRIKHLVLGGVEKMPFPDKFFDLVFLAWVVEHLPDPVQAFREIHRVLKPGGKVIFLTPNAWNYNVWLIRLIPEVFHDFLTRRLYQRQEHDTYPKKYRLNSPRRICRVLRDCGFARERLVLNGDPSYISFNRLLFPLAVGLENLLDLKPMQHFRVHLIGIFRKDAY
jgi:SAM-dependent methyltransferase